MSDDIRRGFLYALANRGITPEEFGQALLDKQAQITPFTKQAAISPLGAAGKMSDIAAAALLAAPIVGGGALGYGAYELTRPDYNMSIKNLKNKELVHQLQQATRRINRRMGPPQVTGAPIDPTTKLQPADQFTAG